MAFTPEFVSEDSPGLTITGIGITYGEILQGLGSIVYKINRIKIIASSLAQLTQPLVYIYKKANGNRIQRAYSISIKPGQYQPVVDILVDMLFDGNGSLDFNVLPGAGVNFYFYGEVFTLSDQLKVKNIIDLYV
jgi:hypothetical protein